VVQGSPKVLIFGIPREPSGNAALKRFYDESVCFHGRKLSPDMESFLNCRFPDDTLLGNNFPLHSWIFIGGRFFGNGYTLVHTPSNELERRLKTVNADRTCGVAGRPPPPPPGGACLHPGSTHIVAADTTVPAQCQALKALLPTKPGGLGLKCNAFADSGPWNNFLECAFRAHNWARFRHGGQGGCGGPTLFAFCEKTFAGDPDAIQCCSNTRCAWSASLSRGRLTLLHQQQVCRQRLLLAVSLLALSAWGDPRRPRQHDYHRKLCAAPRAPSHCVAPLQRCSH
jgi:hypothetical protein